MWYNHFFMKLKGFFLFIFLFCLGTVYAQRDLEHVTDSLLILLNKTSHNDSKRQSELLTHLCMANVTYGQSLNKYIKPLYECALEAGDQVGLQYALEGLFDYYVTNQRDSAVYYLNDAKTKLTGEKGLAAYHYMRLRLRTYDEIVRGGVGEVEASLDSIEHQYADREENMSPYERMEWNILLGDVLLMQGANYSIQQKCIPYYKKALEIGEELPFECAYPFMGYAIGNMANIYMSEEVDKYGHEAAKLLYRRLENIEKYSQGWKQYPFVSFDNARLGCYALLVTLPQVIGEDQAKQYLDLYVRLIDRMPVGVANSLGLKDSYYVTSAYFYQRIGDYKHAIESVDSAIVSAEENGLSTHLPSRLLWKAQTLRQWGKFEEALDVYELYVKTNDSIFTATSQKRLNEIEVSYGLERVKADNAAIQLQSHRTIILFGSVIFVLLLLVFFFWTRSSKKEKQMLRKEMELQGNVLAAEEKVLASEKMKASFIQSIVRELRTPLSAINSATELILDDSLDISCKKELGPIVESNTMHLNSLVDYMLEVSELDSGLTKGEEEMEPANISDMCRMEVKRISEREVKPEVNYHMDLPDDENCLVNIHKRYFSMMIYALISNAHKFTEKGTINISCKVSPNQFEFSIADNGRGIPANKREWIFERFTKVDPYSSGTGLGLYLCRLITERVKGRIWLDTEYTDGARFVFVMPCSKYC